MKIQEFISGAKDCLDLDDFSENKKRRAIKKLLRKLEKRRQKIKNLLQKRLSDRQRKEAKEELRIIRYHIKKGEKLLERLEKNR
ncbi:MAG: hypothetical protein CSA45_01650 [Gammaproteobacteria bacterium]|nr:MAG: hypothetical protein CSA45_01650 [Gammaproteobacteria bacterium]